MHEWMNKWMNEWMNKLLKDELLNHRSAGLMNEQIKESMNGWMK